LELKIIKEEVPQKKKILLE